MYNQILLILSDPSLFESETDNGGDSDDVDYELAISITTNLLLIEIFHRILVICYEVYFTFSGGTPGKKTMGLKIVNCQRCIPFGKTLVNYNNK